MTEQANSAPGGNIGAAPPPPEMNGPSSFVRSRVQQMTAQQAQQPAQGTQTAGDAGRQQHQQPPVEAMVKFADGSEHKESDLLAAIAERAEAASRKATLPSSPDAYEIKLPADFQGPQGVNWEWNLNDPALKAARELAHKRGIDQATFSEMLGVYASTQMGAAIQQAQLRDVNMRQLGAAGPQRVEAVATWLQARAGEPGRAFGDFLRRYPSAQIVKATEALMRAFSNQGGTDYSGQHRETVDANAGKIPNYENMSFAQKRAYQMAQQFGGRPPGRRGE